MSYEETLATIGQTLNEKGITWAVGASMMLYFYGLVDKPNDIDIMIDLQCIDDAKAVFDQIGQRYPWEKSDTYATKYFLEYQVNGVDVDVMSGMVISHGNHRYNHKFDKSNIGENIQVGGVDIPLMTIEEWYVLYQIIGDRDKKVDMLEKYLIDKKHIDSDRLQQMLQQDIPTDVRKTTMAFIENLPST